MEWRVKPTERKETTNQEEKQNATKLSSGLVFHRDPASIIPPYVFYIASLRIRLIRYSAAHVYAKGRRLYVFLYRADGVIHLFACFVLCGDCRRDLTLVGSSSSAFLLWEILFRSG